MWNPAQKMPLRAAERAGLEALVRSGKTPQRVVTRARIVLASADGTAINAIAHELSVSRPTVYLWRDRFRQAGIVGLLKDAPRPGRRRAVSSDKIQAVVDATLHTTPPDATHWSVRTMARAQEVSPGIVPSHLAGPWAPAASGRNLQTQSGPQCCRETPRRHRGASASPGQSLGVLCR